MPTFLSLTRRSVEVTNPLPSYLCGPELHYLSFESWSGGPNPRPIRLPGRGSQPQFCGAALV